MKTSPNGRKLIEFFEGCYLKAYDDGFGTLTIGYGHTTAAGPPPVVVGQTCTKVEADNILSTDLGSVEREVTSLVKVPLNQNQFDALISFEFNTGGLGKSTLLKLLNARNYTGAADQFLDWNHAGGRVVAGLTKRRQQERALFLTASTPQQPVTQPSPWEAFGVFVNAITNIITQLRSK